MNRVVVRGFSLPTQSQTDRHIIGVRNRARTVPVDEDGGVGILCMSNSPGQISFEGGFLFRRTDEQSRVKRGCFPQVKVPSLTWRIEIFVRCDRNDYVTCYSTCL